MLLLNIRWIQHFRCGIQCIHSWPIFGPKKAQILVEIFPKMHFSLRIFSIKSAYLWHTLNRVLTGRRFSAISAQIGPIFGPIWASQGLFFAQKHGFLRSQSLFFAQKHGFLPNFEGKNHHFSPKFPRFCPFFPDFCPFLPIFGHFSLIFGHFRPFSRFSFSPNLTQFYFPFLGN